MKLILTPGFDKPRHSSVGMLCMYVCTVCMYGVTFSSKPTTSADTMDVVFSVTDYKDTSLVVSTECMYVCMYVRIYCM